MTVQLTSPSEKKKKIFWQRWQHQGAESNSALGLPGKGAAKITGLTRTGVQMRRKMPSQDSHELLTETPGSTAKASWPGGGWMVRGWTTLRAEQKEGVCCRDKQRISLIQNAGYLCALRLFFLWVMKSPGRMSIYREGTFSSWIQTLMNHFGQVPHLDHRAQLHIWLRISGAKK